MRNVYNSVVNDFALKAKAKGQELISQAQRQLRANASTLKAKSN